MQKCLSGCKVQIIELTGFSLEICIVFTEKKDIHTHTQRHAYLSTNSLILGSLRIMGKKYNGNRELTYPIPLLPLTCNIRGKQYQNIVKVHALFKFPQLPDSFFSFRISFRIPHDIVISSRPRQLLRVFLVCDDIDSLVRQLGLVVRHVVGYLSAGMCLRTFSCLGYSYMFLTTEIQFHLSQCIKYTQK